MRKQSVCRLLLSLALIATGILFISCTKPEEPPGFTVGVLNPNPGTRQISLGFMNGLQARAAQAGYQIKFIESECPGICDIDSALEKLLARKVDLIFTVTTPATRKAQKITQDKDIPVIFAMHDPVNAGIITNLARPAGNLTGIRIRGSVSKALEWLLTVHNDINHIFVPIKFDTKAARQSLADLKEAANLMNLKVSVTEVNTETELTSALAAMDAEVDAIFILHSILISSKVALISQTAIERKIPLGAAIGKSKEGTLLSFSPRLSRIGNQASRLADLVLRGKPAGEIPCEIAEFFFEINLDTAEKIGITIPDKILKQADHIHR